MSVLPEIDQNIVLKKALSKTSTTYSELILQIVQLETLAEALRDERDAAQAELSSLKSAKDTPLEGNLVP